jgi:hypothetical protein
MHTLHIHVSIKARVRGLVVRGIVAERLCFCWCLGTVQEISRLLAGSLSTSAEDEVMAEFAALEKEEAQAQAEADKPEADKPETDKPETDKPEATGKEEGKDTDEAPLQLPDVPTHPLPQPTPQQVRPLKQTFQRGVCVGLAFASSSLSVCLCRCPPRRRRRSKRPDSQYSHDPTPSQDEPRDTNKQPPSQAQQGQCTTRPLPSPHPLGRSKESNASPIVCVSSAVLSFLLVLQCLGPFLSRLAYPTRPLLPVARLLAMLDASNFTVCFVASPSSLLPVPLSGCPCVCACASPLYAARHAPCPHLTSSPHPMPVPLA